MKLHIILYSFRFAMNGNSFSWTYLLKRREPTIPEGLSSRDHALERYFGTCWFKKLLKFTIQNGLLVLGAGWQSADFQFAIFVQPLTPCIFAYSIHYCDTDIVMDKFRASVHVITDKCWQKKNIISITHKTRYSSPGKPYLDKPNGPRPTGTVNIGRHLVLWRCVVRIRAVGII